MAAGLHGLGPGALATRRTAASHLAGLLARCVRVPNSRLIHYLKTMAEWCHSYITATQESTVADNTKVHGAFHAICHAIFYLVAFKNHYLFMSKESEYDFIYCFIMFYWWINNIILVKLAFKLVNIINLYFLNQYTFILLFFEIWIVCSWLELQITEQT